jgi:hypothetical protein
MEMGGMGGVLSPVSSHRAGPASMPHPWKRPLNT